MVRHGYVRLRALVHDSRVYASDDMNDARTWDTVADDDGDTPFTQASHRSPAVGQEAPQSASSSATNLQFWQRFPWRVSGDWAGRTGNLTRSGLSWPGTDSQSAGWAAIEVARALEASPQGPRGACPLAIQTNLA